MLTIMKNNYAFKEIRENSSIVLTLLQISLLSDLTGDSWILLSSPVINQSAMVKIMTQMLISQTTTGLWYIAKALNVSVPFGFTGF